MPTELTNFPRESTMKDISNALNVIAFAQAGGITSVTTWDAVQQLVRQGLGPKVFPIGSQLRVAHSTYGTLINTTKYITFDVVAHNYDLDVTGRLLKSMTLLAEDAIATMMLDNSEANYSVITQIVNGALCNISLESDTIPAATYDFTAPSNLVVGGLLRLNSNVQMQYYATPTAVVVNIPIVAGVVNPSITTSLSIQNHKQRVTYGSNNWKESAIKQFLDSSAAAGSVWSPKTIYDLPPNWNAATAGFLNGLDANFLAVLGVAKRKTARSTVFEATGALGGFDETTGLIYLPSAMEIFNALNNAIAEGVLYPYYTSAVNADRIKYLTAIARNWWLRSPGPSYACGVRVSGVDGSLIDSGGYAYDAGIAVVPACAIM